MYISPSLSEWILLDHFILALPIPRLFLAALEAAAGVASIGGVGSRMTSPFPDQRRLCTVVLPFGILDTWDIFRS